MKQIVFIIWLLMTVQVQATTYYLDVAAVAGANDGTSWADAWQNPTAMEIGLDAIGDNGAGDTVEVNDGNYGEWQQRDYVRADWCIIKAAEGKTPIFSHIHFGQWEGDDMNDAEVEAEAVYTQIEGLTVQHDVNDNAQGLQLQAVNLVRVWGCTIQGVNGAAVENSSNILFHWAYNIDVNNCTLTRWNTTQRTGVDDNTRTGGRNKHITFRNSTIEYSRVGWSGTYYDLTFTNNRIDNITKDAFQSTGLTGAEIADSYFGLQCPNDTTDHADCMQFFTGEVNDVNIVRCQFWALDDQGDSNIANEVGDMQCVIWNNFTGAYSVNDLTFRNCLFYKPWSNTEAGNSFALNLDDGLGGSDPNSYDIHFYNNTIIGGVHIADSHQDTILVNNIAQIMDVIDGVVAHNNYNIYLTSGASHTPGPNSVDLTQVDYEALFIDYDNRDFNLVADACAVDYADDANAPSVDLRGVERDANPDVGAYEYTGDDITPPSPNPATFATAPTAIGSSSITMTATTASDPCTPVAYSFVETSGNGGATSSGWQAGETYIDTGLSSNTQYTYTVQTRDAVPNAGLASAGSSATTGSGVTASTTLSVSPGGAIRPSQRTWWTDNVSDTSVDQFEIVKAAPGVGLSLYLEYVVINCASSTAVTLRDGTSTTLLGPFEFSLTGTHFMELDFRPDAIQLSANQALGFGVSASATVMITAEGYTK